MHLHRRLALLLALALTPPALAADPKPKPRTLEEAMAADPRLRADLERMRKEQAPVTGYKLSESGVQKSITLWDALSKQVVTDKALYAEILALTRDGEEDPPPSVLLARAEKSPRLTAAVQKQGLTVRDFVLCSLAFQSAAKWAEEQARTPGQPASPLVPEEHVRFVKSHADLSQRFRAAQQRYDDALERADEAAEAAE